jgi:hypothetical protein
VRFRGHVKVVLFLVIFSGTLEAKEPKTEGEPMKEVELFVISNYPEGGRHGKAKFLGGPGRYPVGGANRRR